MCFGKVADYHIIAFCWSILLGLLSWLNTISVPENEGCNWDLDWFMLANILTWQAYVFFWWSCENFSYKNAGKDLLFTGEHSHTSKRLLATWISVIAFANSIVYMVVFVKGCFTCDVFRFQSRIVYQWIMFLITLGIFLSLYTQKRKAKRLFKALIKMATYSLKRKRLQSKINTAKSLVESLEGLHMYRDLNFEVDDFETTHHWPHEHHMYVMLALLQDDDDAFQASELDIHFCRHRLVFVYNQHNSQDRTDRCALCQEHLSGGEYALKLKCCKAVWHWSCVRKRLKVTSMCPACHLDMKNFIRKEILESIELKETTGLGLSTEAAHEQPLRVPFIARHRVGVDI